MHERTLACLWAGAFTIAGLPGCDTESAQTPAGGDTDATPASATGDVDPGTTGTTAAPPTTTTPGGVDSSAGGTSSGDGDDGSAGDDDGSDGSDGSSTGEPPVEPPTTWPESAEEALSRSEYWDPSIQELVEGTVQSEAAGQIIENLHIVDGELIIGHDDVIVRNVTAEGLVGEDAGNHPVQILSDAQNVMLEGIYMGPQQHSWDPGCDMPMFPASGFQASGEASWTMRACATRHTGDAVKANGGTGTFEDCFMEIAMGIWAVGSCEPDHTDVVQVSNGSPNLTFRRVWMDALRYVVDSPDGEIVQAQNTGGSTGLQLGGNAGPVTLSYDTVRFHAGNYTLRIFGDTTLSIVDSVALDPTYGPLLTGDNTVTIEEWSGNTRGDGASWDPPP